MSKFTELFLEWLFRKKSPALMVFGGGLAIMGVSIAAGFAVDIKFGDHFSFKYNEDGGLPQKAIIIAFILGVILTLLGAIWEAISHISEYNKNNLKQVLAVEIRGLRDNSDTPLLNGIPKKVKGHKQEILFDIRQGLKDGTINSPEAAMNELLTLPKEIKRRINGKERNYSTIFLGGLAPVPLSFLTGFLLDDEHTVTLLDWNRHSNNWQSLNSKDDGYRFRVLGLNEIDKTDTEVSVATSVSYQVDLEAVRSTAVGKKIVQLQLEEGNPDCHWSEEKQQALGKQFLETMISLSNTGVRKIHFFCAAQNSLVFRLGRLYDARNLPEIIAYQYERNSIPSHPWGISMPVGQVEKPTVIDKRNV